MRERARSYLGTRVTPPFLVGTGLVAPAAYAGRAPELAAARGYEAVRALERQFVHAHAGIELACKKVRLRGVGSFLHCLSGVGTREQTLAQEGLKKGFMALGFDPGEAWGRAHDVIEELRGYYGRNPTLSPLDPFYAVGIGSAVMANKWMLADERVLAGEPLPPRQPGWLTRLFG